MKSMKIFMSIACILTVGLAGCASYMDDMRRTEAREANERINMVSDVQMLKEQLKVVQSAQEQIMGEIQGLRQLVGKASAGNEQLAAKLDQAVRLLEERDEKMQQDSIAVLSAKMAEILKLQAPPQRAVSGTGVEHVVQVGETLSAIAQAYGVTVQALVKANNLNNPDSVRSGQKLFIPR